MRLASGGGVMTNTKSTGVSNEGHRKNNSVTGANRDISRALVEEALVDPDMARDLRDRIASAQPGLP
jgi:hypothetical protein